MKLNEMFGPVSNDPLIPQCRHEDCEFPAVVWGDKPWCFEHAFEEATAAIFRHGRDAAMKNLHETVIRQDDGFTAVIEP